MTRRWELRVAGPVSRKIAASLPEPVAAAVVEFLTGPLLDDPYRIGKPLQRELSGLHVARRGTFRVVYTIRDDDRVVEVADIAHRRDVYRPH